MHHRQSDVALVMAQLAQGALFYDLAQSTDRKLSARQLRWLFFNMIRTLQPDVFAEAGARNAANSMKVRHSAPKARVIVLEANPHNHAYFAGRYDYAAHGVEYRL